MNCENIKFLNVHNFSQMKYTMDNSLIRCEYRIEIRPWQAVSIEITGKGEKQPKTEKLYSGFQFADGGSVTERVISISLTAYISRFTEWTGNIELSMIFESPYKINSIGFDTRIILLLLASMPFQEMQQ